jgi:hypothetical protein
MRKLLLVAVSAIAMMTPALAADVGGLKARLASLQAQIRANPSAEGPLIDKVRAADAAIKQINVNLDLWAKQEDCLRKWDALADVLPNGRNLEAPAGCPEGHKPIIPAGLTIDQMFEAKLQVDVHYHVAIIRVRQSITYADALDDMRRQTRTWWLANVQSNPRSIKEFVIIIPDRAQLERDLVAQRKAIEAAQAELETFQAKEAKTVAEADGVAADLDREQKAEAKRIADAKAAEDQQKADAAAEEARKQAELDRKVAAEKAEIERARREAQAEADRKQAEAEAEQAKKDAEVAEAERAKTEETAEIRRKAAVARAKAAASRAASAKAVAAAEAAEDRAAEEEAAAAPHEWWIGLTTDDGKGASCQRALHAPASLIDIYGGTIEELGGDQIVVHQDKPGPGGKLDFYFWRSKPACDRIAANYLQKNAAEQKALDKYR